MDAAGVRVKMAHIRKTAQMRKIVNTACLTVMTVMAVTATSCGNDVGWSRAYQLPDSVWKPEMTLEFATTVEDSMLWLDKRPHKAAMSLRYPASCPTKTLTLIIEQESLSRETQTDTLRVSLFDDKESAVGPGLLEHDITVFENRPVEKMARISVRPLSQTAIRGISDVTLLIR